MTTDPPIEYRTLEGWSHEPKGSEPLRFEPGDIVRDVPPANCRALAEAGVIEAVKSIAKPRPAAKKKAA